MTDRPPAKRQNILNISQPNSQPTTWYDSRYPNYSRNIEYQDISIFDSPHSLAFMTSADLDDHTHIAQMFRVKFRKIQTLFAQRSHVGQVAILTPRDIEDPGRYVYYLFTTTHPTDRHLIPAISSTMAEMITHATYNQVSTISIPIPFVADGDVTWSEIYAILHELLQHSDIRVQAHRYFLPVSERTALIRLRVTKTT
jgi:hypothetical protein